MSKAIPQYSFLAELMEYFPRETLERVMVAFKNEEVKDTLSKEEITDGLLYHLFECIKDPYAMDVESGLHHSLHVLMGAIFLDNYVQNGRLEEKPIEKKLSIDATVSLTAQHVKSLLERKLEEQARTLHRPQPAPAPAPVSSEIFDLDPDDFSAFLDPDE